MDWNSRSVMAKVLVCDLKVSEFELQSCYHVHFRTDTLRKSIIPSYSLIYELNRIIADPFERPSLTFQDNSKYTKKICVFTFDFRNNTWNSFLSFRIKKINSIITLFSLFVLKLRVNWNWNENTNKTMTQLIQESGHYSYSAEINWLC